MKDIEMKQPLISVIIPTYSRPENLTRAIDSVLAQTYTNYEIIVVDDNGEGTKNQIYTANLLEKYGDQVTYIMYEANKGANYARNKGIKAAKGEYISFLDDDDIYYENNLCEKVILLNYSRKKNIAIFCNQTINGNFYRWNEILYNSSEEYVEISLEDLFNKGNCVGGFSVFLAKKEALLDIGLLNENLQSCQDWDIYIRLLSNNTPIWGINKQLVDYHFNISGSTGKQISTQSSKVLSGIKELIQSNSDVISELKPKVRADFYRYLSRKCAHYSTRQTLAYNNERVKNTSGCISKIKVATLDALFLVLVSLVFQTSIGRRIRDFRMKQNVVEANKNIVDR